MYSKLIQQILVFGFLLLAWQTQVVAQLDAPAELAMSEAYRIPKNSVVDRIISTDGGTAYFLRRNYNLGGLVVSITIESFDVKTLRLKKAIEVDLKYQKKLRVFHDVFNVNNKFYLSLIHI